MLIRNFLRLLLGVGATILLLSMSWTATTSHSSTKGLGTKLNGIRLVAPLAGCGNSCRGQQAGCENLSLSVCIPTCAVPAMSFASVSRGTAPYIFTVTDPDGNPVSTSPPTGDALGTFFVNFTATKVGPYTATVTDAKGCRVTCSGQGHLEVFLEAPPCQIPGTFTAFVDEGTAPYSFNVTDPNGNPVPSSTPTPGNFGSFIATFTGTKTGTYTVTVTDAIGCQGTAKAEVTSCCSLTQNKWGKNKPKFNGKKRAKTLKALFASSFSRSPNPGDLTIGVPRLGLRSVTFLDDAASCIIDRLPASGSPSALPVGLGDVRVSPDTCQTSPELPLVADKFQNELLGQTIALTLNAGGTFDSGGLSPDFFGSGPGLEFLGLWNVVICHAMVTQTALPGSDGVFGTPDDLLDPGPDGVLGTNDDPKLAVTVPISVLNAIAAGSALEFLGKFTVGSDFKITVPAGSVGRLLMLANFALAGETNLGGASLADINAAVDAINRAFDGCRFLVSCSCPSCADLQITFDPNPAFASATAGCNSQYEFTVILKEAMGVGITFSRLDIDSFQDLPLSQLGFPSRINANSEFRGGFTYCRGSGTSTWTISGTDDNGNARAWSGTLQLR